MILFCRTVFFFAFAIDFVLTACYALDLCRIGNILKGGNFMGTLYNNDFQLQFDHRHFQVLFPSMIFYVRNSSHKITKISLPHIPYMTNAPKTAKVVHECVACIYYMRHQVMQFFLTTKGNLALFLFPCMLRLFKSSYNGDTV
jgi:hypothetical protein